MTPILIIQIYNESKLSIRSLLAFGFRFTMRPPNIWKAKIYISLTSIKIKDYAIQVLVKTWAADLYLIYKLEPKARVCISDKDRMRMT
jgi:hypothetical protein